MGLQLIRVIIIAACACIIAGCEFDLDTSISETKSVEKFVEDLKADSEKPIVVSEQHEKDVVRCVLNHLRPPVPGGTKVETEFVKQSCGVLLARHGITANGPE